MEGLNEQEREKMRIEMAKSLENYINSIQDFDPEKALKIIETVACTKLSLKKVIEHLGYDKSGMTTATIRRWMVNNKVFAAAYDKAKEWQVEEIIEEIVDISDDAGNDILLVPNKKGEAAWAMENKEFINRAKIRIETRKWLASKLLSKKYGDKIQMDGTMEVERKLSNTEFTFLVEEVQKRAREAAEIKRKLEIEEENYGEQREEMKRKYLESKGLEYIPPGGKSTPVDAEFEEIGKSFEEKLRSEELNEESDGEFKLEE